MSYTPTTWENGDIITATKLNNIESGVQSLSNSYTPTTWVNGDIITATKLNNIEQGIANASGGSSDFSTATVTFTAVGGFDETVVGIPSISDNKLTTLLEIALDDGESMTVEIPLYQGYCVCASPMADWSNATGGVSIGETGVLTITGDGGVSIALPW